MQTMTFICLKGFCKNYLQRNISSLINKKGFPYHIRGNPYYRKGESLFTLLLASFQRVIMFNYEHLT